MKRSLSDAALIPILQYDININIDFDTVYDLGYLLVDLQALITGITKVVEDSRANKNTELKVAEKAFPYEYRSTTEIDDINHKIDKILDGINSSEKETLKREINQVIINRNRRNELRVKDNKIRPYPTTTRRFAEKYKDKIKLKSFKQGSLTLGIVSTVISGIIWKFVERIFFTKDTNKMNTSISNNSIYIIKDYTGSNIIDIPIEKKHSLIDKNQEIVNIEKYIDKLVDRAEINHGDMERTIKNLLEILSKEGIINERVLYDEKGIKTINSDMERFIGNFFNKKF
ncbi:MAG: hypothetical protein FH761_17985 [Firmicutes bacterium]|nr:hypothetical protein [Bacillota bacterium]